MQKMKEKIRTVILKSEIITDKSTIISKWPLKRAKSSNGTKAHPNIL